jgi:hypothetical protein
LLLGLLGVVKSEIDQSPSTDRTVVRLMAALLTNVDSWIIAVGLAVMMLLAWWGGWWRGRRHQKEEPSAPGIKFNDASIALLGLLLGFTFSMSLARHEQRRLMVVTDSNAIGDFSTCVSLLKEPVRSQLQAVLRRYIEHRLALVHTGLDEEKLQEIQTMQNQMQALVKQAVDAGTPVTVPLVNTLNEVTSSHASRLSALRDRLPASIVALLVLTAIISMVLMGRHQGSSGNLHLGGTMGFVVLVCVTVWVILDLNQPHRGVIQVSQEPMERLLSGMGKP